MKSKLVIVALFCLTSFMSLSYGQKRETDIPVVIDTKRIMVRENRAFV